MNYDQPTEVSGVLLAFPGRLGELIPPMDIIPQEFKIGGNLWREWQSDWFFHGLKTMPKAKPGIDATTAIRHLACIQESFEPKHEHKQAAVAWLASLWFESPE